MVWFRLIYYYWKVLMMVGFLSFMTVTALIRFCFKRVNVFGSDWRLDGLSLRYFKQVLLIRFHCRFFFSADAIEVPLALLHSGTLCYGW